MSEQHPVLPIGGKISDASISKYRIVTGDTTNTTIAVPVFKAAADSTVPALGVTYEATTAANQTCGIVVMGIAYVEVDGTTPIDINDSIIATTGGKGVKAGAASATTQFAVGHALAPSAADGDIIPVLIDRHLIAKGAS